MMRIFLFLTLIAACKPSPVPAEVPTPEVAAPAVVAAPDAAPSQPPVFVGAPVAVTPLQTLHQNGDFVVMSQRWKFATTTGVAWLVSTPRNAELSVAPSADVVPFAKLLPGDSGPWAAINGGFYELIPQTSKHRAMGLVVAGGNEHSTLTRRGGSGVLYVDADGAHIAHRKAFNAAPSHALQSIDRIIDLGASVVKKRPGQSLAMRSAVALSDERIWLVALAADADISTQSDGSIQLSRTGDGLPLWAFAEYVLAATTASEALNLDGGISTQLAVRDGVYELQVRGVRGTINAVVVRP